MRKFCLILLTLVFMFGLCACDHSSAGQNTDLPEPTVSGTPSDSPGVTPSDEPEDTTSRSPEVSAPVEEPPAVFTAPAGTELCGVDLSGMNREEAMTALRGAAADYALTLDVSGASITIYSETVKLTLDEELFDESWQALENGDNPLHILFSIDLDALEADISHELERPVRNPSVVYDDAQGAFVISPGSSGLGYDASSIAVPAGVAMCSLVDTCTVDAEGYEIAPSVSETDSRLTDAVEAANQYLTLELTYTFTPTGGTTSTETLSRATIASFLTFSDSFAVSVSDAAVRAYAATLGDRYSTENYTGKFTTTGGETIAYYVKYYGQGVDSSALANDIYTCVTTGVSGERAAVYLATTEVPMPYGGSYVEVDLTAQHLWVYNNGVCVVSTPIVSGCVADGNQTPTGVFSISKKSTDCWLVGPTWRDYVSYWLPFYGAYGLHDASWRTEFGEEIYIHEGSHGCVNMPTEISGLVYQNVSVGTPVIVHGGLIEAVDLVQEITGTGAYFFSQYDAPFALDTVLKYDEAVVTYTSDNEAVASVSADGVVTIHGAGIANITVSAAAFTYHTAAELVIEVNISEHCLPGSHIYGEWTQTSAPGCETVGSESRTCSICGIAETQEIPAVGHSFTGDGTCANGCGTPDPNFAPPSEDVPEPETPAESETPSEPETPAEEENPAAEESPAPEETPAESGSDTAE